MSNTEKKHAIIIAVLTLISICAFWALPLDPYTTHTDNVLEGPSWQFLLGTDNLGRDIVSRIIWGLRTSISVSLGVVLMVATISICTSVLAVSTHKLFKAFIGFFVDAVHIMPIIVVCLVILAAFGSGTYILFIGQALAFLPLTMRVCLKEMEYVMHQDFAQTSQSLGMHPILLAIKHGLPFLLPKLCSQCISITAVAIGIEGALSYFGLGITPPHPSLGILLQDSRKYISTQPLYFITITSVFLLLLLMLSGLNFVFFQKKIWIVGNPHAPANYIHNPERDTQK